ncbi:MAG: phosphoribosylamine--glycine ligase [Treponema sp.]|jgi:phosphoribosylamine--glycine ligase|nr:phosphoribosylamine--glycine ligase [Treponema sp.]
MKVLVIGSGGREHAIAWKLAQSKTTETVYIAPGNGGTAAEPKCENIGISDPASEEGQDELIRFIKEKKIKFAVVGPEAPLAAGLVDRFRRKKIAVAGPDRKAAQLEASKVFSKAFMEKYHIRTARSKSFTAYQAALQYAADHFSGKLIAGDAEDNIPGQKGAGLLAKAETIKARPGKGHKNSRKKQRFISQGTPLVIKADGLAAGKGVVIADGLAEAEEALSSFMKDKTLGNAGASVVLEDFLEGKEVSVLAAVSVQPGRKGVIKPFIAARDHKRRFDGGMGPNTGGMGAIAPVPDFTKAAQQDFQKAILEPTLHGMEKEGMDYRGFIFFGLMVKDNRCSLLEYNVRLGDPETQAALPLMQSDFGDLCFAIVDGTLENFPLEWKDGAVCAPVAVADGYPGPCRQGDPIAFNETAFLQTGARLFIAGAKRGPGGPAGSGFRTSGGRVLAVAALGDDAEDARTKAYQALRAVYFEGMDYRRDIGSA